MRSLPTYIVNINPAARPGPSSCEKGAGGHCVCLPPVPVGRGGEAAGGAGCSPLPFTGGHRGTEFIPLTTTQRSAQFRREERGHSHSVCMLCRDTGGNWGARVTDWWSQLQPAALSCSEGSERARAAREREREMKRTRCNCSGFITQPVRWRAGENISGWVPQAESALQR